MHGEKAALYPQVVVKEIFDSKLNPLFVAKNDAEFCRHFSAEKSGEHFGVAAKLDGVIWLWRTSELRVPNFIKPSFIQREKVRIASESAMLQCALINNWGFCFNRGARLRKCLRKIVLGNFN